MEPVFVTDCERVSRPLGVPLRVWDWLGDAVGDEVIVCVPLRVIDAVAVSDVLCDFVAVLEADGVRICVRVFVPDLEPDCDGVNVCDAVMVIDGVFVGVPVGLQVSFAPSRRIPAKG